MRAVSGRPRERFPRTSLPGNATPPLGIENSSFSYPLVLMPLVPDMVLLARRLHSNPPGRIAQGDWTMQLHLIQTGPSPFADEVVVDRFPYVLGRSSSCDHQVFHPMVSRRHAELKVEKNGVAILD